MAMNIKESEILIGFKWDWPIIELAIVLFLGILTFCARSRNKKMRGLEREELILNKLGKEYEVFHDVILPSQGGMSHIDLVLISPYGVFVIDLHREEGTIDADLNSREWKIGKKDTIYNPVWLNRRHINALEDQIGKVKIESLVVFTKARLKGNFGPGVIKIRNLVRAVKSRNAIRLFPEQLKFASKVLDSLSGSKKTKKWVDELY